MNEVHKIDVITCDLIADVVGKWSAVLAWKAVRTDMITPFPTDDLPDCVFDPLVEVADMEHARARVLPLGVCGRTAARRRSHARDEEKGRHRVAGNASPKTRRLSSSNKAGRPCPSTAITG